jgi:DNA-directed RNA polymerase alpha subunit
MKLEDLNLSTRALNGLKRAEIYAIEQLLEKTAWDLVKLWGIGVLTAREIHMRLRDKGLRLKPMSQREAKAFKFCRGGYLEND